MEFKKPSPLFIGIYIFCCFIVALFFAYNDWAVFHQMFSLVDSFYLNLYFKITALSFVLYFTGYLLLTFCKKRLHKLLGLALVVITFLVNLQLQSGTAPIYFRKKYYFDTLVWTTPNEVERTNAFVDYYQQMKRYYDGDGWVVLPANLNQYVGLHKSELSNMTTKFELDTERKKGNYALYVSFRDSMFREMNLPKNENKFVLMFENDAVITRLFVKIHSLLYWYEKYDLIWLDTTNSLAWVFTRNVVSRLSGIVIKKSSFHKIGDLLSFDNPVYKKHIANWTEDNPPYYLDMVLAKYCQLNVLRCAHAPLTHHRGHVSTIDAVS